MGRLSENYGLVNAEGPLSNSQQSIASRLKTLGYKTGYVGKWHLEINRGTEDWMRKNGYLREADAPVSVVNTFKSQGFEKSQTIWPIVVTLEG
jgi:arylsulfatase A-like enzyme